MFKFLSKTLREKRLKTTLSQTLKHRFSSQRNENIIGGGLEKPQGGIKEEKYFSDQNNNLMLKIRDHGTKFKNESSIENLYPDVLATSNEVTALRDSSCINKQKNCLEEAFFLNEQSECCAKLTKEDSFKRVEINEQAETDTE